MIETFLHNKIDIAPNEYVTKYSLNRNFIKLVENDVNIYNKIQGQAQSNNIPSYVYNHPYSENDCVFYRTSQNSQSLYLLCCMTEGIHEPTLSSNRIGENVVVNSDYWKIVGIPSNLSVNPKDESYSYIIGNTNDFLSGHQYNTSLSVHPSKELGYANSTKLFTTFENIQDDRETFFYPEQVRSLTPDNTIIGGYMRKWSNGLLEYDIIFRVGYFGENTTDGCMILSANNLVMMNRTNNSWYFKDTQDYKIFNQGDDFYVIADKVKQVNMNYTLNSFYGDIKFPEKFKDINYMCFSSNEKNVDTEADNVKNIMLMKHEYDSRFIIDGLVLTGVQAECSTREPFNVPNRIKHIAKGSMCGLREQTSFPVVVNILSSSDLIQIGPNAFTGSDIRNITIPKNVRSIGEYAFSNCSKLQRVDMYVNSNVSKQPMLDLNAFANTSISVIWIHYYDDDLVENNGLFGKKWENNSDRFDVYSNTTDIYKKLSDKRIQKFYGINTNTTFLNSTIITCDHILNDMIMTVSANYAVSESKYTNIAKTSLICSNSIIDNVNYQTINPTKFIKNIIDEYSNTDNALSSNDICKYESKLSIDTDMTNIVGGSSYIASVANVETLHDKFKYNGNTITGYIEDKCKDAFCLDMDDPSMTTVNAIGENALANCPGLTAFSAISRTGISLASYAFKDCSFETFVMNLNGTYIGVYSLANSNITELTFTNSNSGSSTTSGGVTLRGFEAMCLRYASVERIKFLDLTNDGVKNAIAKTGYPTTSELSICNGNNLAIRNGCLIRTTNGSLNMYETLVERPDYFEYKDNTLVKLKQTYPDVSRIQIPYGITAISPDAFNSTKNSSISDAVNYIFVPNTVKSIGNNAFNLTVDNIVFDTGLDLDSCGTNIFNNNVGIVNFIVK